MMRKKCLGLLLTLLLLLGACTATAATSVSYTLLDWWMPPDSTTYYCAIRAQDGAGNRVELSSVKFGFQGRISGSEKQVSLDYTHIDDRSRVGHIIVVDTSAYYFGLSNVKEEHIRDVLYAYLDNIPNTNERVKFILSSNSGSGYTESQYMSIREARNYVRDSYHMQASNDTKINSAIYYAFNLVANAKYKADEPLFQSVFIVADPDQASNKTDSRTLEQCTALRSQSSTAFGVTVAVIYREKYMANSTTSHREDILAGLQSYQNFATNNDGVYIQVGQSDMGVDTASMATQIYRRNENIYYLAVDTSALAAVLPEEEQVPVDIIMGGSGTTNVYTVMVDTSAYPVVTPVPAPTASPTPTAVPTATEKPTPTPEPTPVPTETPVVMAQGADSNAKQAIMALYQLGYLSKRPASFDDECIYAYMAFCQVNGLTVMDSIDEEGYALLLSSQAKPAPTATPEVTATPVPTAEPTATPVPAPVLSESGYQMGEQDSADDHFIRQIQLQLQQLNCYAENASKILGTMDQSTMDAIMRYCNYYGLQNSRTDGVDYNICYDILYAGRQSVPAEQKTVSDKVMGFLQDDLLHIGGFAVRGWMLLVLVVALVFLIIVILIIMRSEKQQDPEIPHTDGIRSEAPVQRASTSVPLRSEADTDSKTMPMADMMNQEQDGDHTMPMGFSMSVTLTVSFQGSTSTVRAAIGDRPYVIGRSTKCDLVLDNRDKGSSRRNSSLINMGGQLQIQDMNSMNGTFVNGQKISGGQDADSEKTQMITSMTSVPVATVLNKGDTIQIGSHYIVVNW